MTDALSAQFDNRDERIRYFGLLFERRDLAGIPDAPLPPGYRFTMYQPGDRDAWIDIEQSVGEVKSHAHGLEVWGRYYAAHEAELPRRMCFIEAAGGEKVATATAFYDITGQDDPQIGYLHWVAVRRAYQGRGLSRPLIAHTLGIMRDMGCTHTKISSQTTTWLACSLYLDCGFTPIPQNAVENRDGWRILKALTGHPALAAFDAAPPEEVCAGAGGVASYGGS